MLSAKPATARTVWENSRINHFLYQNTVATRTSVFFKAFAATSNCFQLRMEIPRALQDYLGSGADDAAPCILTIVDGPMRTRSGLQREDDDDGAAPAERGGRSSSRPSSRASSPTRRARSPPRVNVRHRQA